MRRTRSCFSIREVYAPIMNEEAISYESEVQKMFDSKTKINKRYVTGLVCIVIAGIILIIILGTSLFGLIIAFFAACCLIHILRKACRRYQLNRMKKTKEKRYEIRLSCLNSYLRNIKKSRIPISEFQGILEKVFVEFLPALILQISNIKLFNEVHNLTKFLKSDAVHSSLLNSTIELELAIKHKENPIITAARLRKFYIPIMHLLKQPPMKENQELEIVRRISDIISCESTQIILLTYKTQNDIYLKSLTAFWSLATSYKRTYPVCKFMSDLEFMCSPNRRTISPKVLLFRRNSFDDIDSNITCNQNHEKLSIIKQSNEDFITVASLNESAMDDAKQDYLSSQNLDIDLEHLIESNRSPFQSMLPRTIPNLFSGDMQDLEDNDSVKMFHDSEEEEIIVEALANQEPETHEVKESRDNDSIIMAFPEHENEERKSDDEVMPFSHPYQDCFEQLLAIDREPCSEKLWRKVVDKPETKVYQKRVENSPICMIRANCDVNFSSHIVYTAIWDTAIRTQWDAVFHEFRLIDKLPDYEVLYYMIKTPFGITKRDWLQRRVEIHDYPEPGTIMMYYVSCEHPGMPPRKGVIRAETLVSGYIIRPTGENTCTVMIVSQNDVKGLIPKVIVNSVASKAPADWVTSMNRGCRIVEEILAKRGN